MPGCGAAPTREEFAEWVHEVLNRLYDLRYLQSHPLMGLLDDEAQPAVERVQSLRRLLLEAIHALHPGPGVPADSADWRGYRILELRYIEGLGPGEAMQELALGRSQFFREQKTILDALTEALWELWARMCPTPSPAGAASGLREDLISDAVEQFSSPTTWDDIDLASFFDELHSTVEPLARAQGITVRVLLSGDTTHLHTNRVLLRQAILTLLTSALCAATSGEIVISSFAEAGESGIRVHARGLMAGADDAARNVAGRLVAAMGGLLRTVQEPTQGWQAQLIWRTASPVLLVIDDNEGFAELYQRFLAGRDWQIVGANSGREALAQLAQARPTVILLDVLMPSEDGWELLATLKSGEETRRIPVIICSVLEQRQLALALGAEGYLAKPVTQRDLLRTLAPWGSPIASPTPGR